LCCIIRPHRLHAAKTCGLLLEMSHVACVYVFWSHGWAVQKRPSRSRCRLMSWLKWVQRTWGPVPPQKGALLRGKYAGALYRTYAWVHCARRWRICLPIARSGRMHSPPRGWQNAMRPFAKLFWHFYCIEPDKNYTITRRYINERTCIPQQKVSCRSNGT